MNIIQYDPSYGDRITCLEKWMNNYQSTIGGKLKEVCEINDRYIEMKADIRNLRKRVKELEEIISQLKKSI